jgi:hypothetical protein
MRFLRREPRVPASRKETMWGSIARRRSCLRRSNSRSFRSLMSRSHYNLLPKANELSFSAVELSLYGTNRQLPDPDDEPFSRRRRCCRVCAGQWQLEALPSTQPRRGLGADPAGAHRSPEMARSRLSPTGGHSPQVARRGQSQGTAWFPGRAGRPEGRWVIYIIYANV